MFQSFTKFVEVGRVAFIAFGEDEGKLVTIVDIIDGNRVSLMMGLRQVFVFVANVWHDESH